MTHRESDSQTDERPSLWRLRYPGLVTAFMLGMCAMLTLNTMLDIRQITIGDLTGLGKRSASGSNCREFLASGLFEDNEWRPDGCRMLYYQNRSIAQCLNRTQRATKRRNFFLFLGDSRMRELYHVFVKTLVGDKYKMTPEKASSNYTDGLFESEFHFIAHMDRIPRLQDILTRRRTPTFIVVYFGTWFMQDRSGNFQVGFNRLSERLKILPAVLNQLSNVTKVLFLLNAPTFRYIERRNDTSCKGVFFGGRMQPVKIGNKSFCVHPWLRNDWVRKYNKAMVQMITNGSSCGSTYLWTSANRLAQHFAFDTVDGLHLLSISNVAPPSRALYMQSQMLLNFQCNQFRDVETGQNGDDLCCRSNDH